MDYDVVKVCVQNAYKNYGHNDNKFYDAMEDFYKEGKNNPSVAKLMMQEYIMTKRLATKQILSDAAALSFTDTSALLYPEMAEVQNRAYKFATNAALKAISAEDIYKKTQHIDTDFAKLDSNEGKAFYNKWNELYPRSGKIRERIINANRIAMDNVTPKAGWFSKISYAKTFAEYKKDYPKTFYARHLLIMNGQIKEDGITSKVKGWFNRFSYKRLIKSGFCFKK